MNSNKNKKKNQYKLKSFLSFKNDDEKLEFEAEIIHLDIINCVLGMMKEKGITKAELARELKTSKSYITQLFSGDKLINLKLLAKLQRIFNVKFSFVPVNKNIELSKNGRFRKTG